MTPGLRMTTAGLAMTAGILARDGDRQLADFLDSLLRTPPDSDTLEGEALAAWAPRVAAATACLDELAEYDVAEELLAPRALILVDESLSESARQKVQSRVELWLNAYVKRLLGPLFDAEAPERVDHGVRLGQPRVVVALAGEVGVRRRVDLVLARLLGG